MLTHAELAPVSKFLFFCFASLVLRILVLAYFSFFSVVLISSFCFDHEHIRCGPKGVLMAHVLISQSASRHLILTGFLPLEAGKRPAVSGVGICNRRRVCEAHSTEFGTVSI